MISVIIPLYNGEKTIVNTLKSLEVQTYQDLEVIIVNDGSDDKSEQVVANFLKNSASNIPYYFLSQSNQGAPSARNHGYRQAKGDYLLFLDADAILKPNALEIMLETLKQNPNASYAYSAFNFGRKRFKLEEFNPEKLKKMPYIHSVSLILKKDFPSSAWDESLKKFQDWDLWLTMLSEGKTGIYIPQVLFKIKSGGTMSSWLPAFAYKLMPFLTPVKEYKKAMEIIKNKHGLN
jgi:glycosyltransferase involved in cell wall biosynthesis